MSLGFNAIFFISLASSLSVTEAKYKSVEYNVEDKGVSSSLILMILLVKKSAKAFAGAAGDSLEGY